MTTFTRRQTRTKRNTARRRSLVGALALAAAACSTAPIDRSVHVAHSASAPPSAPSPIAPELAARIDAAARDPDEEALVRLGHALGARALMAAARDEARRKTALAALPYAVDAEVALRDLARLAVDVPRDAEMALETAARVVEAPRFHELLDPEGIAESHALLRGLASDSSRSPDVRALAETAYRRLEEYARGRVDLGGAATAAPKR